MDGKLKKVMKEGGLVAFVISFKELSRRDSK